MPRTLARDKDLIVKRLPDKVVAVGGAPTVIEDIRDYLRMRKMRLRSLSVVMAAIERLRDPLESPGTYIRIGLELNPRECDALCEALLEFGVFSKPIHKARVEVWRTVAHNLGLSEDGSRAVVERMFGPPEILEAYGLLELNRSCSMSQVHRAFRKQVSKYHPDRVVNLAVDFQQLAASRTQELSAARSAVTRWLKDKDDDISLDTAVEFDDVVLQYSSFDDDIEL